MSADNWRLCPKCKVIFEQKKQKAQKQVEEQYGKVSSVEYARLLQALNETEFPQEETLREDYEMFMGQHGDFYVSYSCRCNQCGFSFKYRHTEQVNLKE